MNLFSFDEKPERKRLTAAERTKIFKRQKNKCADCKLELTRDIPVHFDHKRPIALGGSDTLRNIQALCPTCHAKKTREDRDKIAKDKRKKKEDPFGLDDLFSPPRRRGRRKNDPYDIFP